MATLSPCIWFDGAAEAAATAYAALFPDTTIANVSRYGEGAPLPAGTALVVELDLAGQRFQLLNGGPQFRPNPSISFFVQLDDADAARRIYAGLAEGGQPLMPLGAWPWSPCYGWVQDRFGVSWQVMVGPREASDPVIVPCLMFAEGVHGRAAEAIRQYVGLFGRARVGRLEPYAEGEGPTDTIKHGRFVLEGQELVAMDSHAPHGFTFGEGLSLSVGCADQAEVDRLWAGLVDGGSPGRCGWLKDRYGVSWQLVPAALGRLMSGGAPDARARTMRAMLAMGKLDVAALEAAHRGDAG